ncbi:hypothetical protein I5E68_06970 [Novosphingobium sp. YJ-S2-02]|uniref:Uncharacterized protein n=1 Tax=Novosphingobium aureum TaxID=2792964 RepID=A0A931ML49_9SPHN|nr:hypothetical protein [Novosphingobium aureum]MBH0112691.1 hypothetical protein [Novosphingobium aureum]
MKFGIKRPDGDLVSFHSGKPILFDTHGEAAAWLMRGEVVEEVEADASSAIVEGAGAPSARSEPDDLLAALRWYRPD